MDVQEIQSLLAYNHWANRRLLAVADLVPPERLAERFGGGTDSLLGTFVHLLSAEEVWLRRWQGDSPTNFIDPTLLPDLAAIRARWLPLQTEIDVFAAGLTPERLATPVRYVNFAGEPWEYLLWQMMVHVVNHGTHHRSEAADLLTRLGHAPPPMDFLVYYDELES